MKAKIALAVLVAGFALHFMGALFKILHWAGGNVILLTSDALKTLGGIALLYFLIKHGKNAFNNT